VAGMIVIDFEGRTRFTSDGIRNVSKVLRERRLEFGEERQTGH